MEANTQIQNSDLRILQIIPDPTGSRTKTQIHCTVGTELDIYLLRLQTLEEEKGEELQLQLKVFFEHKEEDFDEFAQRLLSYEHFFLVFVSESS